MLTYMHLGTSADLRQPRAVSEAFIQDFVLVFDSKHWLICGDLVKRDLHPRSAYSSVSANRLSLQRYTKLLMDDHCHNTEFEYDSGDRSPGTRLMRYYVSDDPRPDPLHRHSKDPDDTQSKQPVSTPSTAQQVSVHLKEVDTAEDAASDGESAEKDDAAEDDVAEHAVDEEDAAEEDDADEKDAANAGADPDAEFRDLEELRGDVIYNIAERYSHNDILQKIATLHPQVGFGSRDLTWRLANSVKARARKEGVTRYSVRAALDATRIANGVEFPRNYRAKSQSQQEGVDGKTNVSHVTTRSGDSDDLQGEE
jgi:hypothetical protein